MSNQMFFCFFYTFENFVTFTGAKLRRLRDESLLFRKRKGEALISTATSKTFVTEILIKIFILFFFHHVANITESEVCTVQKYLHVSSETYLQDKALRTEPGVSSLCVREGKKKKHRYHFYRYYLKQLTRPGRRLQSPLHRSHMDSGRKRRPESHSSRLADQYLEETVNKV